MAAEVKLPRLGQGMETGTIVKWLKAEGDEVAKGEPLYELDTDKVTQEVEAEAEGVLLKIAIPEGEVPVGTTIAFIGEAGESVPDVSGNGKVEVETAAEPVAAEEAPEPKAGEPPEPPAPVERRPGERIKASPLARRIARERGIDLASIRGTGPEGRIIAEDVDRAGVAPARAAAAAPPGEVESVPLTSIRRTIARRLTEAWTVPVFQLQVSADMARADALVAGARELHPEVRVSVTDLLTKVCASALQRHPDVNVSFTDEALLRHPSANVGIAVAAPQGLVVPVVKSAERLLTRYFERESSGRLPDEIEAWLKCRSRRFDTAGSLPSPDLPLTVDRNGSRLLVRRVGHLLLLKEEDALLTKREREIVDLVAEGRTNGEIAVVLTVAPATVRKHLENIYVKLGVHTRTAAAARARN